MNDEVRWTYNTRIALECLARDLRDDADGQRGLAMVRDVDDAERDGAPELVKQAAYTLGGWVGRLLWWLAPELLVRMWHAAEAGALEDAARRVDATARARRPLDGAQGLTAVARVRDAKARP